MSAYISVLSVVSVTSSSVLYYYTCLYVHVHYGLISSVGLDEVMLLALKVCYCMYVFTCVQRFLESQPALYIMCLCTYIGGRVGRCLCCGVATCIYVML